MQSYSRLRIPVFEHNFPFTGINYFIYDNDTIHIKAFVTSRGEEEELMKEETRAPYERRDKSSFPSPPRS